MSLDLTKHNGQNDQALSADPSFVFAHTKAERLSTAVHMVTRFMDSSEPLRKSLRSESLKLLSRIFILEEGGGDSITGIISRIISLLDIAYRTQYISEMNWNIIRGEYLSLGRFIEERNPGATLDSQAISERFFHVEMPKEAPQRKTVPEPAPVKDKTISKRQSSGTASRKRSESLIVKERKNGRREAILKLIKERKKVGVRDVAEVVTGVSEKTLQRELLSLVEEGILRKEGERRWSTYSLA